ncbi:UDP-N-acetylglucosamine 2-epimerase (hydrolyzing) [Weissella confusa]|uniref:UDP-N-acetylglucosamine 2-epimerase n=1 Tax=Weissella confusa TaxID=1583 RepID=UPI00107F447C|nr:UDP-N-acetylglucosamine 2-epimerase [Weissella confusa]TGE63753.1 UDP-N-acetylglucosamine 2-epimerase (hydrolyzing) [Weissella confusa]
MRNILYVTGSRADFGIIQKLLVRLNSDESTQVKVVATGMQVEPRFGNTVQYVERSGLDVIKKIPMHLTDSTAKTSLKGLAILQDSLVDIFEENDFDAVIILGDRYEMLAVANAATLYRIPIIHLHGGEQTLGNFDEAIRHSITKLSHLHLTSTEEYRQRVIQMGEAPSKVVNVGSLGVENVLNETFLPFNELISKLDLRLDFDSYLVVLFHPETFLSEYEVKKQATELRQAIEMLDTDVVIIGSNVDAGADVLSEELSKLKTKTLDFHVNFVESVSSEDFHALVSGAKAVIGNSSSGLIEVPILKTPTINLGNRQLGRIAGPSVVQLPEFTAQDIAYAVIHSNEISDFSNPYYKGNAVDHSLEAIDSFLNNESTVTKAFYDLK